MGRHFLHIAKRDYQQTVIPLHPHHEPPIQHARNASRCRRNAKLARNHTQARLGGICGLIKTENWHILTLRSWRCWSGRHWVTLSEGRQVEAEPTRQRPLPHLQTNISDCHRSLCIFYSVSVTITVIPLILLPGTRSISCSRSYDVALCLYLLSMTSIHDHNLCPDLLHLRITATNRTLT